MEAARGTALEAKAQKADGTDKAGEVVAGRYEILEMLGKGGMGNVYKARRLADDAMLALKLLHQEHLNEKSLVERFLREAKAAGLVQHANIVSVVDSGSDDRGVPFLVQELLVGQDLRALLKACGRKLDWQTALDVMIPVVDAVACVHESRIIHRDLKPANIFLARSGDRTIPKLLDFGISQISQSAEAAKLTATGMMMGTPAYMSPEQVMAQKQLDARADVWALGVILYEIVAGKLPFTKGDTPGAIYVQICTVDPPPLEVVEPAVPADYARVVRRCLRRNRDERYKTAREVLRELMKVKRGKPILDAPSSSDDDEVTEAAPSMPDLAAIAAKVDSMRPPGDSISDISGPRSRSGDSSSVTGPVYKSQGGTAYVRDKKGEQVRLGNAKELGIDAKPASSSGIELGVDLRDLRHVDRAPDSRTIAAGGPISAEGASIHPPPMDGGARERASLVEAPSASRPHAPAAPVESLDDQPVLRQADVVFGLIVVAAVAVLPWRADVPALVPALPRAIVGAVALGIAVGAAVLRKGAGGGQTVTALAAAGLAILELAEAFAGVQAHALAPVLALAVAAGQVGVFGGSAARALQRSRSELVGLSVLLVLGAFVAGLLAVHPLGQKPAAPPVDESEEP